ncbi:SCO family protein [Sphingomonas sp.]|uniref:SCO family protein n=2 Tax=Sphingomonas sp. TaxID=28214 RepID=UPI0035A85007
MAVQNMNQGNLLATTRSLRLALGVALAGCAPPAENPPLAGAAIGGPFSLTDQHGRKVSDRDFAGRFRIVYFGYTYCPDVCPVDVQTLAAGLKRVEQRNPALGARIVPIFISVDPARDTPPVLKQFVSAFHPRMVGLTGTPAAIAKVQAAFAIFAKAQPPAADGGYIVDHSRQAYLFSPDGKPLALLPQDGTPDQVADEIVRWAR